jgi:hypothetical protein
MIKMPDATPDEFRVLMEYLDGDPDQRSTTFKNGIRSEYLAKLRKIPWPSN